MRIIYHPLINLSIICQIQVAQNDITQAMERGRRKRRTHTPIHTKNEAMRRVGE